MNPLKEYLYKRSKILFVCIGTDRCTGDALGPLVGKALANKGYNVLGTLHNPVHALTIKETMKRIEKEFSEHFIVAIDACLGNKIDEIGKIFVAEGTIKPGLGIGKLLPEVGDISIKGIVNIKDINNMTVIKNTRLSVVWDIAEGIIEMCDEAARWSLKNETNEHKNIKLNPLTIPKELTC